MLTELRIQNFKSWRDTGAMRFAPLTGFFGPNSSGKTSILQFLLMLKQTVLSTDNNQVLNLGQDYDYVNLGTFTDMVFLHQHPGKIIFEVSFQNVESAKSVPSLADDLTHAIAKSSDYFSFEAAIKEDLNYRIAVDYFHYQLDHYRFDMQCVEDEDLNNSNHLSNVYQFNFVAPEQEDEQLVAPPFKFYIFPIWEITKYTFSLNFLTTQFEKFFTQLRYMGPIREYPSRIYLWQGSPVSDLGAAGQNAVRALLSTKFDSNPGESLVEEKVAHWLKYLGMIESFNLRPIAENRREYELRVRQTPNSPEVLITEVGFGVSQILPVLTLCYYVPEGSTIILEQPEIHLHPAVQAGLADVFVDVIKNRGVQIILESHSEHLLNRLQRRMAEELLVPSDVALYFTHMENGESKLEELKIDEYGNISNWPENFFGDEMGDLVAMAEAAMQRQMQQQGQHA